MCYSRLKKRVRVAVLLSVNCYVLDGVLKGLFFLEFKRNKYETLAYVINMYTMKVLHAAIVVDRAPLAKMYDFDEA